MSDISSPHNPQAQIAFKQAGGVNRSFATLRSVMALILREMATRYGRSPGGYVWAIVEPMAMILILAVAFAALVRTPPLGNNFILFFATGILPFQLYGTISNNVARALTFSRPLLFYPAVTWVDAVIARFTLNLVTDILVMLLLFITFISVTDITLFLEIGPIVTAIALAALLGLAVGLVNCVLFGFFPVWMNIWGILNRPMFFVSGILFLYEDMPQNLQVYLGHNPLVHVTALMRAGFYPTYDAEFASPLFVMCCAVPMIFLGLLLLGRFHREILNR